MKCTGEMDCPAARDAHERTCVWHPENMQTMTLSAADFDKLVEQLDAPPKENPKLRALMQRPERWATLTEFEQGAVAKACDLAQRGKDPSAYVSSLAIRIQADRLGLVIQEIRRQLEK